MYQIDKTTNRITKLEEKQFSELGIRERNHLQEWLANFPEALGEELLIIQKEFNGFNDTNERLDLLAIDKLGNLVIIENKLDDSGRDVTWQALKYASYCSTLKKEQVRKIYQEYLDKYFNNQNAEEKLKDFFRINDLNEININSGQTQRIMFVAANFRKEVTSTVLWLMNYKLRIQCFKATPYESSNQLFLNIEQIIPLKEAEDYVISMAEKTQEDITTQDELKSRHQIRLNFWKELLTKSNSKLSSWQNISPSKDNWIATGSGFSGVTFNFVISNYYARVEVYIGREKNESKQIFNKLKNRQENIESIFGSLLCWEELPDNKASRIKYEIADLNYFQEEQWSEIIEHLISNMEKLELAFRPEIDKIKVEMKLLK